MATARRLPSGSWRVLAFDGTGPDGKRKYRSFTAPTKKQAEFEASLYAVQRDRAERSGITAGEAIDRYIAAKDAVLSPKTIKEYWTIRKTAMPELMARPVSALTAEEIQAAVNAYARSHAPKTVRNAVSLLASALKMHDPSYRLAVTLPQPRRPEIAIPDAEAIRRLLDACIGTPMYTVILLAASLGLRRSEICALEWDDVDAAKRCIRVGRALVATPDKEWAVKTTKTATSARTLDLPDFLLEHLASLPRSGPRIVDIINPAAVTLRFLKIRARCGVSCRFHDLRHYYASLLLALNIPDLYAMKRMGHATPHMLKTVYQHLIADEQAKIDAKISAKIADTFAP